MYCEAAGIYELLWVVKMKWLNADKYQYQKDGNHEVFVVATVEHVER